jgi:hypothetical protein
MKNIEEWERLPADERERKENVLAENERSVKGSLQLANETLYMLQVWCM